MFLPPGCQGSGFTWATSNCSADSLLSLLMAVCLGWGEPPAHCLKGHLCVYSVSSFTHHIYGVYRCQSCSMTSLPSGSLRVLWTINKCISNCQMVMSAVEANNHKERGQSASSANLRGGIIPIYRGWSRGSGGLGDFSRFCSY